MIAFFEKYLLIISISFFITSFGFAIYVLFSKDILRIFDTGKVVIGVHGKITLETLPDVILDEITVPLFRRDPSDGSFTSDIIDKWERNSDFTKFTFHLREGLTYTDGTPFTSADIRFVFKDVVPDRPDSLTITYTLNKPFPQFLTYLSKPIYTVIPFRGIKGNYIIKDVKYTADKDSISKITLAPLKLNTSQRIYKIYKSESEMASAYKLFEIDAFTTTSKSASENFQNWPRTLVTVSADYDKLLTLFFNNDHLFLKEKDVRYAILGSIPISELRSNGTLAVSPVSATSHLYDPSIPRIPENPELDRDILKKYFSEATESAKFKLSTSLPFLNLAHTIQGIIQGAGGEVTIDINGLQQGDTTDLILGFWDIPLEVNQYYVWHSSQIGKSNISGYNNQKVDKLLEDFRASDSVEIQKQIMSDFQHKLADDIPAAFLYYPSLYTIERKR